MIRRKLWMWKRVFHAKYSIFHQTNEIERVTEKWENRVPLRWSSNVHWILISRHRMLLLPLKLLANKIRILLNRRVRHAPSPHQRSTTTFALTLAGKLCTAPLLTVENVAHAQRGDYGVNGTLTWCIFGYGKFSFNASTDSTENRVRLTHRW